MAKKYKIGASIALDGEREYKQALADINAGLKVNYSEMKLTAAQYDRSSDSQKAMKAQIDVLAGTIAAQTEKVKTLRAAVQQSTEANGAGSRKTMEWQASLNKADTELIKMNRQMKDYKTGLTSASQATDSLAGTVRGLAEGMGINLPPMADKAIGKLEGVSVAGAALVGVIGAVVFKLGKMTVATAKSADDIMTLAKTTGMTTDALQEFTYASELLDVSTDTLQGSLSKMVRTMGDAQYGTEKAQQAFGKLHVKYMDTSGALRDGNIVFYEVIDALSKISNETERDALSMQIFGRSARDLNPMLEAGSEALKGYAVEAHNVGYVMDTETLVSFGELDDALQRFAKQQDAVSNRFAEALLPVMSAFLEVVNAIPTPVLAGIVAVGVLATVGLLLAKTISAITTAKKIASIANVMLAGSNATLAATNTAVGVSTMVVGASFSSLLPIIIVVAAVILVIVGLFAMLSNKSRGASNEIHQLSGQFKDFQTNMADAQTKFGGMNYQGVPKYARGTSYHPGGLAVINDNAAGQYGEIVDLPTGARVYPAGTAPGGDTIVLNVNMEQVDEISKLMRVVKDAKNSRRRGYAGGV